MRGSLRTQTHPFLFSNICSDQNFFFQIKNSFLSPNFFSDLKFFQLPIFFRCKICVYIKIKTDLLNQNILTILGCTGCLRKKGREIFNFFKDTGLAQIRTFFAQNLTFFFCPKLPLFLSLG